MGERFRSIWTGNRRIWIAEGIIILFILITGFLNFQMEDEIYYGLYQVDSIPEEVDGDNGIVTVKESYDLPEGTLVARIAPIHIGPGHYTLEVDHQNDVDYEAVFYDGEKELGRFTLPKESLITFGECDTDKDLYNFHVEILKLDSDEPSGGIGVKVVFCDDHDRLRPGKFRY